MHHEAVRFMDIAQTPLPLPLLLVHLLKKHLRKSDLPPLKLDNPTALREEDVTLLLLLPVAFLVSTSLRPVSKEERSIFLHLYSPLPPHAFAPNAIDASLKAWIAA